MQWLLQHVDVLAVDARALLLMVCFQVLAGGMVLLTFVRFMDCVQYEGKWCPHIDAH